MAIEPTKAQARAINIRQKPVLVSAGAGSGKTRVLTERLMKYIETDKKDIDSFVVITFTRAAAAELKSRITEELQKKNMGRQIAKLRRAEIGTIHSFCSNIIRANCHAVGLSPDFAVVSDERAAKMKSGALDRILESFYAEADKHPGFMQLADTVGAGRDDKRLRELISSLYEKMQSHARPEKWAEKTMAMFGGEYTDAGDSPWGKEILSENRIIAAYWRDRLDAMLKEMAEANPDVDKALRKNFQAIADGMSAVAASDSWDKTRNSLSFDIPRSGAVKGDDNKIFAKPYQKERDAAKKALTNMKEKTFSSSSDELLEGIKKLVPSMQALFEITLAYSDEYDRLKRDNSLVDYADLEHFTAQLLTNDDGTPNERAAEISEHYTEIMVDEYQDVNGVQETIFRALAGPDGRKMFAVGDVKQSIYRFRLADPAIFRARQDSFDANPVSDEPGIGEVVLLLENLRSRAEILNCANAVFGNLMSGKLGDTEYDEKAALKYGATYYNGTVPVPEIKILDIADASDSDSEDEEENEAPDKLRLEAEMVAGEIEKMVREQTLVTEGDKRRPARYGDFAILLRSANKAGPVFRSELVKRGIPVVSGQGGGFFKARETAVFRSLLKIIDNPNQDIPLVSVLSSPLFGFTPDELADIRCSLKGAELWAALCRHAVSNEKSLRFTEMLKRMRKLSPDMGIPELVNTLMTETDAVAVFSAMGDGEQRLANLYMFTELAASFEGEGYRGLHSFNVYLDTLENKDDLMANGAADSSAVQIMSIHKSKGLEFPIVFLSNTGRRFNESDLRDTVLVHSELGIGPYYTDTVLNAEYATIARKAIAGRLKRENLSEEVRLLYVALTRPKERLIITGVLNNAEDAVNSRRDKPVGREAVPVLMGMKNYLEWLINAAAMDGEKHLRLTVVHPGEEAQESVEEEIRNESSDTGLYDTLCKNLSFEYPYAEALNMPSKLTATELKDYRDIGVKDEFDDGSDALLSGFAKKIPMEFSLPDFAREDKPATGAEKGTATHLALQYMNFDAVSGEDSVEQEIARLAEQKFISERQAKSVNAAAIAQLFDSELGVRIRNADELFREFRFSVLCDSADVLGTGGEKILLQGVVDLCIREGDTLTVIDYKTDAVFTDKQVQERAELYSPQVRAYAEAMSRIFGLKVKECVLYFLNAGRAESIEISK